MIYENKFSKYLIYAIGEILLVVIGILIALQVNNWNEKQKESTQEKEYLKGIRNDLRQDINQSTIIVNSKISALNIVESLEPYFKLLSKYKLQNIDTVNMKFIDLFHRGNSFRSTIGTYNSLIADGKSNLINNRILFQKIQTLYNIEYPRINSIYEDLKLRENNLAGKYSYEKFHWSYENLMKSGNKIMISDIANFWENSQFYCAFLDDSKVKMKSIIAEIDLELEK